MQKLQFWKISPCGNMTVLLDASSVPDISDSERSELCNAVIQKTHLDAEQAGIADWRGTPPRLTMGGGELCLNASRAFAALLANNGRLNQCEDGTFCGAFSASGLATLMEAAVTRHSEAEYTSGVRIDLGLGVDRGAVRIFDADSGIRVVWLEGIVHVLLEESTYPLPYTSAECEADAAVWRNRLGLNTAEAVGIIRIMPDTEQITEQKVDYRCAVMPYVWVKSTQSGCLETSCGSGSLAAALGYLWGRKAEYGAKNTVCSIRQPGGDVLHITLADTDKTGIARTAWISGAVKIIAQGETFV